LNVGISDVDAIFSRIYLNGLSQAGCVVVVAKDQRTTANKAKGCIGSGEFIVSNRVTSCWNLGCARACMQINSFSWRVVIDAALGSRFSLLSAGKKHADESDGLRYSHTYT
jgi:hypothetical protein